MLSCNGENSFLLIKKKKKKKSKQNLEAVLGFFSLEAYRKQTPHVNKPHSTMPFLS